MDIEKIIKEIGDTIQTSANVKAVFGKPVKLGTHTVIPVAKVSVSLGGGGSGHPKAEKKEEEAAEPDEKGFGGGGGMKLTSTPLGYIHEKEGEVVYTAIEVPQEGILGELSHLATHPLVSRLFSFFTRSEEEPGSDEGTIDAVVQAPGPQTEDPEPS